MFITAISSNNSNNINNSIYKSSLKSAALGGALGAVLQGGSLIYDKLKHKDIFQFSAAKSTGIIIKNAAYCAGLSALLTLSLGLLQKLLRKNEN